MNSHLKKRGPYFTMGYNRFLRDPTIKPTDKIVFLCLKSHKDGDDQCIPPVDLIADELGVTRKTVFSSLNRLVDQGLISRTRRSIAGNQAPNQYFFHDLHYVKHLSKTVKSQSVKKGTPKGCKKGDTRKIKNKEKHVPASPEVEKPKIIPFQEAG